MLQLRPQPQHTDSLWHATGQFLAGIFVVSIRRRLLLERVYLAGQISADDSGLVIRLTWIYYRC